MRRQPAKWIAISIHALREESDGQERRRQVRRRMSIHAHREESDWASRRSCSSRANFNPRPPRGERQVMNAHFNNTLGFQSTPSARRATSPPTKVPIRDNKFQSTPSARRATAC